jgi:hypothetical protein
LTGGEKRVYGLVNKAVEEMVCMHYGEPVWERIKERAGIDVDVFISNEGYPDDITYRLVAAASAELALPADAVLEAFGSHWVLHTAREAYGGLLQAAGRTLPDFLANLPDFHSRVQMIFPKLQPPRFRCTDVKPGSLRLHYHTHRPGLTPFVIGLLKGLGTMFSTPVDVRVVTSRDQGADHDEFEVVWSPAPAE